jgi:2-oxo-4-hydroxy-4-carboxy-5-ureidoimidazoline decarboxylase
MMDLQALNHLDEVEARGALLRCCGSARWAERMAARRPFADASELHHAAEGVWRSLEREDWLEAFRAHPRIGNVEALRLKFATTAAWSEAEQAGVAGAAEETLQALAEGDRRYEARFGYLFIVCATGKSAAEMLALLEQRLTHEPAQELRIAAAEQEKITLLRLQRLCS